MVGLALSAGAVFLKAQSVPSHSLTDRVDYDAVHS